MKENVKNVHNHTLEEASVLRADHAGQSRAHALAVLEGLLVADGLVLDSEVALARLRPARPPRLAAWRR